MLIDFFNIIEKYNVKTNGIIHIGAHHGQEITDYVKLGVENLVFFEPYLKT